VGLLFQNVAATVSHYLFQPRRCSAETYAQIRMSLRRKHVEVFNLPCSLVTGGGMKTVLSMCD
jgi:hypothetical protein